MITQYPYLQLVAVFVSKSIMSDVNTAITIFFCMFLISFSVDFYYVIGFKFVFYEEHITVIFFYRFHQSLSFLKL